MPDVILGTSEATEQPVRYGYDPQRGPFTQRVWRGIKSAIDNLTPMLTAGGYRWEVTRGLGDIWEVSASIAADTTGGGGGPGPTNDVVNEWELLPNVTQHDLLRSDSAAVSELTDDEINQIRHYLQNPPPPNSSPAWTNVAKQEPVYNLMSAGVTSKTVFQPVLRHTLLVPKGVNPGLAFQYVGWILSNGSLYGREGLPADFMLSINEITRLNKLERADNVSLTPGWLKAMPTLQLGSNGRTTVALEYQYGYWATLLYGDAI